MENLVDQTFPLRGIAFGGNGNANNLAIVGKTPSFRRIFMKVNKKL